MTCNQLGFSIYDHLLIIVVSTVSYFIIPLVDYGLISPYTMRKLILLLCCTISSMVLFAQTTTSQTENCINCQSTIDPSAAFEIRTTTQGILIPKMSAAEKEAIQNPAKGLLVFC